MSAALITSQPAVPTDVTAFAVKNGVADYVLPVLEMARCIFPGRPITPRVEEDAEILEERYIAMQVDVSGLDENQLFAAQQQWSAGIFQQCPAVHVHLFSLGMWASK
jgi:hypothetical protein